MKLCMTYLPVDLKYLASSLSSEEKLLRKEKDIEFQASVMSLPLRAGALTAKLKVEFHTILGCSIRF